MVIGDKPHIQISQPGADFSSLARLVDEKGLVVIEESGQPKYALLSYSEYARLVLFRERKNDVRMSDLIDDNLAAFQELAKRLLPSPGR
ncbi:MAG: hypothetical protein LBR11_00355 [Deltaproteobacteria bacterium]|jgi:hypothetical protein|nr:hypothetical protein [Deltaproteobacteria bacterium]